jgi:cobalamin biosynthesis Co2+ chelatase CbiK
MSDEGYLESVKKIIRKIRTEEQTGIKRPQEPLEKVKMGKVEHWIVQNAKDMGIDIEGYEHEITGMDGGQTINTANQD